MKGFRRKLLASTLIVGLLFGSVASVNAANLPATANTLVAKLNQVYGYLSTAQKSSIDTARADILTVLNARGVNDSAWLTTYGSISDPLWSIIGPKVTAYNAASNPTDLSITEADLLAFALHFGIINYDSSFSDFETYRTDGGFRDLMNDLALLGGLTGGMDDLDFVDVTSFYTAIETATRSTVATMPSFDSFNDLLTFKNALQAAVQGVLDAEGSNMAIVLNSSGITADALLTTKLQMQLKVPSALNAELALASAYRAMILATTNTNTNNNNTTDPVVTPGGTTLPEQAAEAAKEVLLDLAAKLADLPAAEKKAEVKKAEKAVEKAIKEAGRETVTVVVTAGVAKPTIDTTAFVNKAKEAKALADTLNADLAALGGKKVKVEFTMDLGTVDADSMEIPFDKAFLDEMAAAGVDSIAIVVNGIEISVNTKEFGANTTLNIQKKSKAESGDASGKKAASDYYEFDFSSNGSDVGKFSNPVLLKIPVNNVAGFDTELLTLAKVEDGQLIFYVGKYNEESGSVEGSRDSFSTYVIVENKVEFNDIAKVKSWAGRSIEVAAAKGIIAGRGEGVYDPSANVTRAEFAKMLVSTFSLFDNNATESFDDVKDTDWFKSYVAIAVAKGIITGRSATSFDPNAPISRQEMAVMVARTIKLALNEVDVEDNDAALSTFTDAGDIGSIYKASAALVVDQGIINGYAGKFDPKGVTTRAQAAVVIKSLIDLQ